MVARHWRERRIVSVFRLPERAAGIVVVIMGVVVFISRHGGQAPGAVLGSRDGTTQTTRRPGCTDDSLVNVLFLRRRCRRRGLSMKHVRQQAAGLEGVMLLQLRLRRQRQTIGYMCRRVAGKAPGVRQTKRGQEPKPGGKGHGCYLGVQQTCGRNECGVKERLRFAYAQQRPGFTDKHSPSPVASLPKGAARCGVPERLRIARAVPPPVSRPRLPQAHRHGHVHAQSTNHHASEQRGRRPLNPVPLSHERFGSARAATPPRASHGALAHWLTRKHASLAAYTVKARVT